MTGHWVLMIPGVTLYEVAAAPKAIGGMALTWRGFYIGDAEALEGCGNGVPWFEAPVLGVKTRLRRVNRPTIGVTQAIAVVVIERKGSAGQKVWALHAETERGAK